MARLSSYNNDENLTPLDKLVGSSYQGLSNGVPLYTTSSYTLGEISRFLTGYIYQEDDAFNGWELKSKIEESFGVGLDGNYTTALESKITSVIALEGYASDSDLSDLEESVTTLQGDLGNVQEDLGNVQSDLSDVQDGISGAYGVELNVNNRVASLKNLSTNTAGVDFVFDADTFKIFNGVSNESPFYIDNNVVKIKSANLGSVSFGSLTGVPDTFITTVIYADDADGTNPTTFAVGKNYVAFYNGATKWVNGDALPEGLVFRQITGPQGEAGADGADGTNGVDGADGYTPLKNIDYFDGIPGDSANVVVTDATVEQCANGGKVLEFYVGETLIDTQVVCNGVNGVDGLNGEDGNTGDAGIRIATGIIWYSFGSSTQPESPSNTGITFNFDNGTFSSLPTDWQLDPPEMEAGTASNLYWTSRYQVFESSSGSNSGTPSFYTPIRAFAFNQVVTFSSLGVSGSTIIDGSRITTGFIRSSNWDAPDAGETYADAGTAIYLETGNIISKNFAIVNGDAYFKGDVTGATGTFSGALNVNSNFLVSSSGSVQIKGGDTLGNSRFEILDDSGNSKYRLYGGGINLNSWSGDNALSGGKIFYGSVAEIYSGNGTTVTTDHALVINVYGGSKKLITRSDNFQVYNSAGGDGAILTVNGTIRATGDVVSYYSSDQRFKDNITPIENALEKINSISGYEFDWNENQSNYTGHDIGVIAQEIQNIAPELVMERPDGYLGVKYDKIVAILIQGMKEQQTIINDLISRIQTLENS